VAPGVHKTTGAHRFGRGGLGKLYGTRSPTEEADVLRILFRIVTIVSAVKLITSFIGRRRQGGR
jgi:hypothetical protein